VTAYVERRTTELVKKDKELGMLKLNREAKILVNGHLAGVLSEFKEHKNVRITFQYDEDYLKNGSPIGYHIPLKQTPFEWNELPYLFQNLASEGWLRKTQCEEGNINNEDTLGLLLANGKNLIGALAIIPHIREQ
tara:strand:+ start:78 stop:482 length:405 start_codon:yes stop_codon:yes gene_type:complete